MKPIKILIISDKKAGHLSVSHGVIQAIEQHRSVHVKTIEAKLRGSFWRPILTHILNLGLSKNLFLANLMIKNAYIMDSYKNLDRPDLIISTGGNSSFLNILLAAFWGCPNLYCSTLRSLKPELFTRVLVLKPHQWPNEILLEFSPNRTANAPKSPKTSSLLSNWALLIGGDSNEYSFDLGEYAQLTSSLLQRAKEHNKKLLITTSRRTEPKAEAIIKSICDKHPDQIEKLVLFHQNPEKVVNQFLQTANTIFCTEDSGSMINEAILSRNKVYTIFPKKRRLSKSYAEFLNRHYSKGYIHQIPIDNIQSITFNEPFLPLAFDPHLETYKGLVDILPPMERE